MTQPQMDHLEAVRPESIKFTTLDGVSCYAFTVKSGDVQQWDSGNIGPNGKPNERAEISYAPAPDTQKSTSTYNVREGMTQTYDVDYRFAPGFPPHVSAKHEWAVLTQFHPQPTAKGIPGFPGATVHDGRITFESPTGDGSYFATLPLQTDVWFKLRMVVKWAADKTGYVKILSRDTGLVGRYDGPTIAPGEFKYVKQGYYRAGGLPEATVYQTLLDVSDGDLSATEAPVPVQPPAPPPVQPTPVQPPGRPSVDPEAGAALLIATVEQLDEIIAGAARVRDQAQALLDKGPYKPAG